MDAKYVVLAVILGVACAQTDPSPADIISKLPPGLQGNVSDTQIEELKNKSTSAIRAKCDKFGGPGAYAKLEKEIKTLPLCVQESLNITNVDDVKKEIEAAKPHGGVDEVFIKYCARTPEVKGCFNSSLEALKPCLSTAEQKNLKIIYNVTEQLVDFICYKEGDRIALFIAEGGPECYEEKVEEIRNCVNETIGSDPKLNTMDINSFPEIKFGEKECNKLNKLQQCVVHALETCQTPTSANIVESLFKFVRKATPCAVPEEKAAQKVAITRTTTSNSNSNSSQPKPSPSAASGVAVITTTFFMGIVTAFVF